MIGTFVFASLLSGLAPHKVTRASVIPPPFRMVFQLGNNGPDGSAQDVKVSVEYYDKGEGDGFYDNCTNWCMGRQHDSHQACTTSCDIPCDIKFHDPDFYPELDGEDGYDELRNKLSTRAISSRAPDYSGEMVNLIWRAMKVPLSADTFEGAYEWPCWNKTPCSTAYRGFPTEFVGVKVTFEYSAGPPTMGRIIEDKREVVYLATYEVPVIGEPEDGTDVWCRCAQYFRLEKLIERYTTHNETGIYLTDPMGTHPITDMEIARYGVHLTFPDMNTSVLTGSNPTGMDATITVWPGTRFISNDHETQNMMVTKKLNLVIPSWGGKTSITPSDLANNSSVEQKGPMSVEGTAVCINMKKHPPTDKVAYTPGSPSNSALKLLGKQANNDRILGPWTQTRFWIASDGATFADVQKAMFPKPTEGHYLRSLYDVGRITHVNFKKSPFKECLDPKVIIGASASRRATDWFVETLSKIDPTSLAKWVTANPNAFSSLFAADAEEYAMKHGADVGSALCCSESKDVQLAGVEYLMHAVPEMARPNLVKYNGLSGLSKALDGSDNEVVSRALDVAETYRAKNLRFGLVNMTTTSGDLKARAAKLLADLK